MRIRRIATLIMMAAAFAGVGSCGFSPLYARPGEGAAPLANVAVDTGDDPGRIGYLFAQAMADKLGAYSPSGEYVLETIVSERRRGFGIRVDDVATRYESTVTARYRLVRASDGEVLTQGAREGVASYDVSADPFAELSSEERSIARAVGVVAEKVRLDLTLYFADADLPS
ncbi:MAG: LPS assembly lipoprotein LptE [Maricaulaceae bacterium]|jgi:LPS-assembly lipoprotein